MRAEIGKIILDKTFSERQALNLNIVSSIEKVASNWGISIERYEIKDVRKKRKKKKNFIYFLDARSNTN